MLREIHERITYKEAGERYRLSRERLLASPELSGSLRAWRLWAVCMEETASYSKAADRVHAATLAGKAGLRRDKVSEILYAFDAQGVLVWRKDRGSRSPGFLALPSLHKNPDLGAPTYPTSGPLRGEGREGPSVPEGTSEPLAGLLV